MTHDFRKSDKNITVRIRYSKFNEYISFVRLTFNSKLEEKRNKKTDLDERRKLNDREFESDRHVGIYPLVISPFVHICFFSVLKPFDNQIFFQNPEVQFVLFPRRPFCKQLYTANWFASGQLGLLNSICLFTIFEGHYLYYWVTSNLCYPLSIKFEKSIS